MPRLRTESMAWRDIAGAVAGAVGVGAVGYAAYAYGSSGTSLGPAKASSALEVNDGSFRAPVAKKEWLGDSVVSLTLSLPQKTSVLGLAPGRHVDVTVNNDSESTRPYTPVRADGVLSEQEGSTTLVVKVYPEGKVSPQLANLSEGLPEQSKGLPCKKKSHTCA